jgi:hypothetical protein
VCSFRLAAASSNNKFWCVYIFCPEIRWSKRSDRVLPYRQRAVHPLPQIFPNEPVTFWLVVVSAEAIKIRGPTALSILIFSSPLPSAWPRFLSNAPSAADTIIGLVVASGNRAAAIQGRCSAHLLIFQWAPFRCPKQGDQMQRTQARKPDASSGSWEAVAPRFGSMADVAMEREGKAAGR